MTLNLWAATRVYWEIMLKIYFYNYSEHLCFFKQNQVRLSTMDLSKLLIQIIIRSLVHFKEHISHLLQSLRNRLLLYEGECLTHHAITKAEKKNMVIVTVIESLSSSLYNRIKNM